MSLDLNVGSLVRGSSGLLLALLGGGIALLLPRVPAHRRRLAWALLLLALGWGAALALVNFLPRSDPAIDPALEIGGAILSLVAAAGAAVGLVDVLPRERTWRFVVLVPSAVMLVANVVNVITLGDDYRRITAFGIASTTFYPWYALASRTSLVLALALATALAARPPDRGRRLLAAAFTMWSATVLGEFAVGFSNVPTGIVMDLAGLAAILVFTIAWLPRSRLVACTPLVFVNVGLFETAIAGGQTELVGAIRIVAAALVALAIVRHDLLGTDLRSITVRRGTTATVGLATLFIVAQVAQNFFAAEYGLLMGGIVAGALLFAASPIQRAMESNAARSRGPSAVGDPRLVDAYRHAVRAAITDGHVTRAEEIHLGEVAASLGISPADAVRLRHEVEDESSTRA